MTIRISIPAKIVLENKSGTLDLVYPPRCSRCDAAEATRFETHVLKYEAGLNRFRQINKKFRSAVSFRLRLPLCELCYQANFIENPDSCDRDANPLGRIAHWRSVGIITASLVACLAFIVLMRFIPLPATMPWLQNLWLMQIGLALLIYAITFGAVELKNQKLRQNLVDRQYDAHFHRAEVFAKMQLEDPRPDDVAVIATLENDGWADECADHYGWLCEKLEPESKSEEVEAK
jgi:hypothetical protein